MKEVLSFIIGSILTGFLFVCSVFYFIVRQPEDIFSDSYMAALRTKYNILKNTDEPKIILVAGSSAAFSVDNALLEKETGYKVANMALHAGLGALFETSIAKANINEGDIVLLGLEWGWHIPEAFDNFGTDLIMSGIDNELEMYKYVPASKYGDLLGYLFTYANIKNTYSGSYGVYSRSSFDENANMTLYRNSQVVGRYEEILEEWGESQTIVNIKNAVISEESIEYLKKYKEYVESKGASIYCILPPLWEEVVQCDYEDFREYIRQEEEKIGILYISDPAEYLFPAKYMFDLTGMYHCSTEGAIYRTELIVKDLKNAGLIEDIDRTVIEAGETYEFEYMGDFQSFTVLEDGYYQIEAWGAGGSDKSGSYVLGKIEFQKGEVVYVYVGGQNGWNSCIQGGENIGGDTDIRLVSGDARDFDSLESRIMSASGSEGSSFVSYNGDGRAFINTRIIESGLPMPSYENASQIDGNSGYGHARITYIGAEP